MPVVSKQKGGYVVGTYAATGFINRQGGASTNSANAGGETVASMNIVHVKWSCHEANAVSWTVGRGGNTILTLFGSGVWDLAGDSTILDNLGGNPQANVVITKVGTGQAQLVIKLHKKQASSTYV